MSNTVNLNIGLITVGSVIAVPTQKIYNDDVNPILNVKVIVDIPDGLQYDSSVLPSGTYNSGTNTWTIPTILAGGYTEGIFNFLVTDDTSPEYTITFTATKDGSCENCTQNNNICVITNGISCTQMRLCDPLLAMPEEYTFIKNSTNNAINVSTNDQPCPGALSRTYQWLDITNVNGTITNALISNLSSGDFTATILGASATNYQWMLNGIPLAGANAQSLTALVNGEYSVHVKDKNGCEQTSNPINISNVGIDDLSNSNSNFLIYPNPTSTYLRIHSTQNSEYTAKVVSVNGDVITQFSFINYIQLNTENWAQGMYLLTFRNKDGYTINFPIAK